MLTHWPLSLPGRLARLSREQAWLAGRPESGVPGPDGRNTRWHSIADVRSRVVRTWLARTAARRSVSGRAGRYGGRWLKLACPRWLSELARMAVDVKRPARPMPNTTDFRCFGLPGVVRYSCSVSSLMSVSG